MSRSEASKDEGESDDKEQGAARVTLGNTFPEDVLNRVAGIKGCRGISRKVNCWGFVKEEAKPSSQQRAV